MHCPCWDCICMCICRLKKFSELLNECQLLRDYYVSDKNAMDLRISVFNALDIKGLLNYGNPFLGCDFWD
ncbi:MAG: hypothetical protein ACTSW1_07625 [Candidatus Hodarchaeales archaeon]